MRLFYFQVCENIYPLPIILRRFNHRILSQKQEKMTRIASYLRNFFAVDDL